VKNPIFQEKIRIFGKKIRFFEKKIRFFEKKFDFIGENFFSKKNWEIIGFSKKIRLFFGPD
jgi:hypothetical protein